MPGCLPVDRLSLFGACIGHPVGKAVATETGEPHQIDILRALTVAQMFEKAAKGSGRHSIVKWRAFLP